MYICKIVPNLYRDSVSLMQLSAALAKLPGIEQASAIMATLSNLELLREARLLNGDKLAASPNDLLLALRGKSEAALEAALAHAVAALDKPAAAPAGGPAQAPLTSLQMALGASPQANLALISVPGEYAAAEAMKALRLGLNVMLFSDNVSGEDEVALKRYARSRGLLVMGPDCGTAIIDGVPLGFANAVRRGAIGVVGASGTGTQQVASLVHRAGAGISHAIGTGGHDLSQEVGGITMLAGLEKLAADEDTKVIVLISKPPAPAVAKAVLAKASTAGKPVVVNFVGSTVDAKGLHGARTLEEAAQIAVELATGRKSKSAKPGKAPTLRFAKKQRYIRGLFSGGTFCYEASALIGNAWSNAPVDPQRKLTDVWKSREHTLIDLGDDVFTRGRPHPMIDHRLRNERLLQEAADAEVAVILMDVVLGYGSHPDPAAEMVPAMRQAQALARKKGRTLAIVGTVCGTDEDPQGLERQEAALRDAGMLLETSNARAALLAAAIVRQIA
ncbi:MAG TPA: acyl-CoA synthetase FdrA [Burkholderiales bacterium]|nr:acyl-CoA synthetase FdrA [Burkholderiales bacterium]